MECNNIADNKNNIIHDSFYISPRIKKIVSETPIVSKDEFASNIRKGDIITVYSAKKKSSVSNFTMKMIATLQGSPYSSSKFAICDNVISGYGLKNDEYTESDIISKRDKYEFICERDHMLLIRLSNVELKYLNKAIEFIEDRQGLPYSHCDLFKTGWNRLVERRAFTFLKDKPLKPREVKEISDYMFCSNLIALAFLAGGYLKSFNNQNPWDVWPRDFIIDPSTKKICRVDL